jgi:hypothetical protein
VLFVYPAKLSCVPRYVAARLQSPIDVIAGNVALQAWPRHIDCVYEMGRPPPVNVFCDVERQISKWVVGPWVGPAVGATVGLPATGVGANVGAATGLDVGCGLPCGFDTGIAYVFTQSAECE